MGLGIALVKRDTERDIYDFLQNGRVSFPAKKVMRNWYAVELDCGQAFSCADCGKPSVSAAWAGTTRTGTGWNPC